MLGVTPDHTSFNHFRVCNHFVHIFGHIGDSSCYCTNCAQRKGLTGAGTGDDSLMGRKNPPLGFESCQTD